MKKKKSGKCFWKTFGNLFRTLFLRMEMEEEPLVRTAAAVFQDLCYNYRDQLTAGIICAGWDKKKGGQVRFSKDTKSSFFLVAKVANVKPRPRSKFQSFEQVFSVPIGGMLCQMPFAIGGSGSTYLYGYVDATYKEGMTKKECVNFVTNGNCLFTRRLQSHVGVWYMWSLSDPFPAPRPHGPAI